MAEKIKLHPFSPHRKRIFELSDHLKNGSLLLFPTDSQYALGCMVNNKKAIDRIRLIRQLPNEHYFTLICNSLSEISRYAHISDENFSIIKRLVPGPFTFILPATKEVPKKLIHPKRKTIGFRLPESAICQALTGELVNPLIAVTAKNPGSSEIPGSREELFRNLEKLVDIIIDDEQPLKPGHSTVIDLTGDEPVILRSGLGMKDLEEAYALENSEPPATL